MPVHTGTDEVAMARATGSVSKVVLGLYGLYLDGREFGLSDGRADAASVVFTEDAGKGPAHTAVHLYYGYPVDFKLQREVVLQ